MSVHRFFTVGQAEGEYGGLILTLPSGRGVMEYQIEMAANNDIEGLLSFCHVIADGKPRFRYDVGCLVPLNRYMEQYRLDIRLAAEVLLGISSAVCGLEKYLLEEKCVILELDMVYIEPVRHSIKLVYLPVDPPDGEYTEFLTFVTELLKCVDTVDATSKLFRRRILEEVKKTGFRYETFTDFLLDIICFSGDGSGEPAGLPDARANMGVNSNAGKNPKGASGWLIGKKPRHTSTSVSAKAESSRGNQALLMPVLCGILVVIAYFGIYSVLHGAYQNAVLLVAIAAELFLLRFFVQKGNRCEAAAAVGGNMGGGAMIGGSGVGNAVGVRSGNGDNVRGSRVK